MIRFLNFLEKNFWLNVLLVIIYFLMVTLPHEWVGLQTVKVFGEMSRDQYNLIILLIGVGILFLYLIPLFSNLRKIENKFIPIAFLLFTIFLTVLTFNTLVIINIEIIHFIQYAVLAILVFPIFKRFLPSLFKVMMLGTVDEAYQYYYLAPERTNYFDFNDVILNTVGAAFGLVFLRTYPDIKNFYSQKSKYNTKSVFLIWVSFLIVFFVFIKTSLIQVWPSENGDDHWSLLVKKVPEGFWSIVHPNVTYHVILPLEGLIYMSILLIIYSFLKFGIEENNT